MIIALSIRSFLLIERLDIEARDGFTALTGETGAGKSIILDALGLALGATASRKLVRKGADQASILAEFALEADHPAWSVLADYGFEASPDETLMLKRVIPASGPARAFINDQPASASLLAEVGETLVEIHGQHAASALMRPSSHRMLLDTYAGNESLLAACATSWAEFEDRRRAREALEKDLSDAEEAHAWLVETVEELEKLAPKTGEFDRLTAERNVLMQSEKIAESASEAFQAFEEADVESCLARASRATERVLRIDGLDTLEGGLSSAARAAAEALERALIEVGEASAALEALGQAAVHDPDVLERTEQRLISLRSAARKHDVEPAALVDLLQATRDKLALSDAPGGSLDKARAEEKSASARWQTAADRLTRARQTAAARMEKAIAAELKPLKLERTKVKVRFDEISESASGAQGRERAEFEIETNPGAGFGPLKQIASGGELARFSLALQCVLAETTSVPVMVFDEADQGVGGAVAAAIGERLTRLGQTRQVFAITHSPQVAAAAANQWLVSKSGRASSGVGETRITGLDAGQRHEEIARMLSGATVTQEARAAATRLLEDV
ncbi:DNA repair protein RecN [Henriciella litoralis]|uniref:DNA repair protein RecN n=1 Tax=Henriciella litoralis TaxID=568102 RepID=UPI0009FF90BA|nr:DNA repair protein RecN [Henriciella litoralis]